MRDQNVRPIRFPLLSDYRNEDTSNLRASWGWFFAGGTGLVFLGLLALSTSAFATVVSLTFLGSVLLIAGIIQVIHSFSPGPWSGFLSPFLSGVLSALAGFLIMRSPGATAIMLTFLLAPLFMALGIVRSVGAVIFGYPRWGLSLVSGMLTFILGMMLWNQWPSSGLWFLGTVIGIELVFSGIATIAFSFGLKALSFPGTGERLAA